MKKLVLFASVLALFNFTSCSTVGDCANDKEAFLENYNDFMDEVDDLDLSSSDEEWKEYDARFKKMTEECYEIYEEDMSVREIRKFWGKTVSFYVDRYGKGFAEELADDNSDLNISIKKNFADAKIDLKEALEDADINININGEELEEMLEELGGDIEKMGEKWGKKLEEIFEKKDD